jgi:hypothetical protein
MTRYRLIETHDVAQESTVICFLSSDAQSIEISEERMLFISKNPERNQYRAFTGFSDAGYELKLGNCEITSHRPLDLRLRFVGCELRKVLNHKLAASINHQEGQCPVKIHAYCLKSQSIIQKRILAITHYFDLIMGLFFWFEPTFARGLHQLYIN